MNFIKKNYEKLILAVLLTVFIILLALQLLLWKESAAIQVEKMKQFRDPPPNYVAVKFEDKKSGFMVLETLQELASWDRSLKRGGSGQVYTDFMEPYPMALCPHCIRVIPVTAFPKPNTPAVSKCPLCRKDLHAPLRSEQNVMLDTDGDRIPDQAEKLLGLNPEDATDGYVDSDADEFSNYEEYLFKTKLDDPKDHPPYYSMLRVARVERPLLPFRLKNVSARNPKDMKTAIIQIEVDLPGKLSRDKRSKEDRILYLGNTFQTMAGRYKIVDVRSQSRKNDMGIVLTQYEIMVSKDGVGKPIPMKVRQNVYELQDEIHLVRTYMNRVEERVYRVGSEFTLGSVKAGFEKYKVLSVNPGKKEVILLFNDKKVTVGAESLVSSKIRQAPKVDRPPRKKKKKQ